MRMTWLLAALLLAPGARADTAVPPGCAAPASVWVAGTAAKDALLAGLSRPEAEVRRRAAMVVGQMGDATLGPPLTALLDDPDRDVRIWAGIGLASLGDERGLPAARAALVGNRPWVRYYALIALWRLGGGRALTAIGSAANDPDPLVAEVTRLALAGELREWDPPDAPQPTLTGADLPAVIEEAASLLVDEADAWFHMGDYRQCIRAQEAALSLDPELGWLHGVNGWLYWSLGRHAEALGAYRRWVQADPGSWEAHYELGYHYFLLGKHDAAAQSFGRSRELGCAAPLSHMHPHALERAGRLKEALQAWRELAEVEPDSPIPPHHIQRIERLIAAQ